MIVMTMMVIIITAIMIIVMAISGEYVDFILMGGTTTTKY